MTNPTLKYLTVQGIAHALENSGYGCEPGEYRTAKFLGFTSTDAAQYRVTFADDEGAIDSGYVYVSMDQYGLLKGEF
jgi:hypothetical protein